MLHMHAISFDHFGTFLTLHFLPDSLRDVLKIHTVNEFLVKKNKTTWKVNVTRI